MTPPLSEREGRTGRAVRIAIVTIVVVLLAEGAARALVSRFPDAPAEWGTNELPYKRSIVPPGGSDILIVGVSDMDAGVNPGVVDSVVQPDRPTFNGSLGATSLRIVEVATEHIWLPELQPEVVVIGIISRHMNPNDPEIAEIESRFFEAMEVKALLSELSIMEQVDRQFMRWSRLWEHRAHLRSWDALMGEAVPPWGPVFTADGGQWTRFLDGVYEPSERQFDFIRSASLKDWEIATDWDEPLRRLVEVSRAHGAEVLLLDSPTAADWTMLHPNGQADVDRYRQLVSALADELQTPLIRPPQYPDEYFADVIHLNQQGADELSRLVGRCIVDLADCPTV